MSKLQQINDSIPNATEYILKKLAELQQSKDSIKIEIEDEENDCPTKLINRTMALNGLRARALDLILNGNECDFERIRDECSECNYKINKIASLQAVLAHIESQIASIDLLLG